MTSRMAMEIAECPAVARAASSLGPEMAALARMFGEHSPSLVVLCGRGSSGHAALYLRYLIETRLELPVSIAAPSVASATGARVRYRDAWHIVLSQSGESPDLIAASAAARETGALTIALVNQPQSALAEIVDIAIPLRAGTETSVAATKSVLATMAAGARLVAEIANDDALRGALERLPGRVEEALACDWRMASDALGAAQTVYTTGRGFGFAVAKEIALKMAEALRIPAHAYSAAEIMHGPRAAVDSNAFVLGFETQDATAPSVRETMRALGASGARVLSCGGGNLPWIDPDYPAADAIAMLPPAWRMIEAHARRLGYDPDSPPNLSKVTRTL